MRTTQKIKSKSGASIIFALLLFLVCSTVCSVLIVAAVTASGRMANLAESDQRYYNVTSASELVKNIVDEESVKIVKETTMLSNTSYVNGESDSVTNGNKTEKYYIKYKNESVEIPDDEQELSLLSFSTIPESAAFKYYQKNELGDVPVAENFTIVSEGLELEHDPLRANVVERITDDGNLIITVYNTDGSDKFTQEMIFTTEISKNKSVKTTDGSRSEIGDSTYKVATTKKVIETTTLRWKLTSIKNSALTGGE